MTLDRTGEPIEPVDDGQPIHDPRCDGNGWVDRDGEHPRPCLDCKPHLAPAKRRARIYGPHEASHPSSAATRPDSQETP